jgi:D-aminoacyl-tRNA deacylase
MMEKNGYPNVVGIGGGHYAPRFTEISLKYKINFGHMIPNYQLENSSDDDIIRMLRLATEGTLTKMVYIHKRAMKKSEVMHISDLIESIGLEIISSKDLEFLV